MGMNLILIVLLLKNCYCQTIISEKNTDVYDFIIVGAGTSGCVIANRLSRIPHWKVLVLEAGEEENIDFDIPAIPTKDFKPILWNYKTARNNFSCLSRPGGVCTVPHGKVVGGTSVINDMKYARGSRFDYEEWEKNGATGWSYEDVLGYFKVSEDYGPVDGIIDSSVHATGGELHVAQLSQVDQNIKLFMSAFKEFGIRSGDVNANSMESVSLNLYTHTNNTRLSSNGAFLMPVRKRKNLTVITKATVTKIILEQSTMTAVGVMFEHENNEESYVFAKKEVILTAGTVNSAKILMISGIGPKEDLIKFNITSVVDLPVGKLYQDQVTTGGLTLGVPAAVPSEKELVHNFKMWFMNRTGPFGSTGISQLSAYLQLYENEKVPAPDVEFVFEGNFLHTNKYLLSNISVHISEEQKLPLSYYNTINVKPVILKPKSRGYLTLNPKDPLQGDPIIHANLLQNQDDIEMIEYALDLAQDLLGSKIFEKLNVKIVPLDIYPCDHKDEKWKCVARHFTKALGNGIGTCKMGLKTDTSSVVGPDLRVHGVNNLRVADASVMPSNIRANNYAVTIMIGEKASHMIEDYWIKKGKT